MAKGVSWVSQGSFVYRESIAATCAWGGLVEGNNSQPRPVCHLLRKSLIQGEVKLGCVGV